MLHQKTKKRRNTPSLIQRQTHKKSESAEMKSNAKCGIKKQVYQTLHRQAGYVHWPYAACWCYTKYMPYRTGNWTQCFMLGKKDGTDGWKTDTRQMHYTYCYRSSQCDKIQNSWWQHNTMRSKHLFVATDQLHSQWLWVLSSKHSRHSAAVSGLHCTQTFWEPVWVTVNCPHQLLLPRYLHQLTTNTHAHWFNGRCCLMLPLLY